MPLKAGVVQFSPLYGDVEANLRRLEALVFEGVSRGASLLVLPEMAWTGYLWANPQALGSLAEAPGAGVGQERMAQWARRWGVTLVYGFPERDGNRLYNSQGLVWPDGRRGTIYRKTHLFQADEWWAWPGTTGYLQWESPWGPIGSGICMDLNYPDLADFHTQHQTRVLAFSTNWIDQNFDVVPYWEEHLRGSQERGFPGVALFANRGGAEFGISFRGQSSIFRAGRLVATLPGTEDGVLVMDVDSQTPPWRDSF